MRFVCACFCIGGASVYACSLEDVHQEIDSTAWGCLSRVPLFARQLKLLFSLLPLCCFRWLQEDLHTIEQLIARVEKLDPLPAAQSKLIIEECEQGKVNTLPPTEEILQKVSHPSSHT